ncbi:MAG: YhfC family glutamic-type intramembrane protease [Anaerolineaceae bacterium]|nr:YhfC family glutamic-type intramembrane protease [Anaerolineaceae bacterium]
MVTASYIFAILFEIVYPILVGTLIIRRYKTGWKLFGVGILTFLGSQIVHVLLLSGLTEFIRRGIFPSPALEMMPYAIVVGLLAGLCEETARFTGYKILKERGNSWGAALTLGSGHGGIESMLIGLVSLANFALFIFIQQSNRSILGITPAQVSSYLNIPWTIPLAAAVERLTSLVMQLTLSVMVWIAVSRRAWVWFGGAILWHALVDGSVILLQNFGLTVWTIEGILTGVMLINFAGLYIMSLLTKQILPPTATRTNVLVN